MLVLMHIGCGTMKCGFTMCRNHDSTCDGGRILVIMIIIMNSFILWKLVDYIVIVISVAQL